VDPHRGPRRDLPGRDFRHANHVSARRSGPFRQAAPPIPEPGQRDAPGPAELPLRKPAFLPLGDAAHPALGPRFFDPVLFIVHAPEYGPSPSGAGRWGLFDAYASTPKAETFATIFRCRAAWVTVPIPSVFPAELDPVSTSLCRGTTYRTSSSTITAERLPSPAIVSQDPRETVRRTPAFRQARQLECTLSSKAIARRPPPFSFY
jgi:hypothetical protein